jgi:hypothetical protein
MFRRIARHTTTVSSVYGATWPLAPIGLRNNLTARHMMPHHATQRATIDWIARRGAPAPAEGKPMMTQEHLRRDEEI